MIQTIATWIGYFVIGLLLLAGLCYIVTIRFSRDIYGLSLFRFGVFVFEADEKFMRNAIRAGYIVRNLRGDWRIGFDLPGWLWKRVKPSGDMEFD